METAASIDRRTITSVESNIQGGVALALGVKTVLQGPNESGKSSVIRAIELALLGGVSDFRFRDWAKDTKFLAELAPKDAETLWSRVRFSDGTEATYTLKLTKTGKPSGKAAHNPPSWLKTAEGAFPFRAVLDAARGSDERLQKFLIHHAVGEVTADLLLEGFSEESRELFETAAGSKLEENPIEALLAVADVAKKRGAAHTKEANQAEKLANLQEAESTAPSSAELQTARESHEAARKTLEAARNVEAYLEASAKAEPLVAEQARLMAMPTLPPEFEYTRQLLKVILKQEGVTKCLCCGGINRREHFQQYLDNLEQGLVAQDRNQARLADVERQLSEILQGRTPPAGLALPDVQTATNAFEEAGAALDKLLAATGTQDAVNTAKAEIESKRKLAAEWNDLAATCNTRIHDLLTKGQETFVAKVQPFLGNDKFVLKLQDRGKIRVRVGLERDGVLHTALSGGAGVRVLSAIAAAMAESTDAFSILITEDRAFDRDTFKKLLRGLSKGSVQTIVSACHKTNAGDPWHVVDTYAGQHRTTVQATSAPAQVSA